MEAAAASDTGRPPIAQNTGTPRADHSFKASCVVVVIEGGPALERCVDALLRGASRDLEIIIAAKTGTVISPLLASNSAISLVERDDQSPIALAAAGVAKAAGEVIALTEDHCEPTDAWMESLRHALAQEQVVAAGGPIITTPSPSAFDWAFYLVDFYRYAPPVSAGPVSSLSVCNAAYKRSALERIRNEWQSGFHETRVNNALRKQGQLVMSPAATITCDRRVPVIAGLYERFRFGRLFAAGRLDRGSVGPRMAYGAGSVLLPFLLFARVARKSLTNSTLFPAFVRSSFYLAMLIVAWSVGEFVGYVTGLPPASAAAARNR